MKQFLKKYAFLFLPILLYLVFRTPSFFETFWYGDEGIYAAVAQGLHEGKLLYKEIWDHKPPLIYWIYYVYGFLPWEIAFVLLRATTAVLGIVNILLLGWILRRKLLVHSVHTGIVLTLYAFFAGTPFFEGNTANAEMFFVTINLAILCLLLQKKLLPLVGFLAFLSLLLKVPAFGEAAGIILCFTIIILRNEKIPATIRFLLHTAGGFIVPLIILLGYFGLRGNVSDFIQSAFFDNVGYASLGNEYFVFLGLPFPPNLIKTFILLTTLSVTGYAYWNNQLKKLPLIVIWVFAIELYATLLSGRIYAHYFLQVLPGITLLSGYLLNKITWEHTKALQNVGYIAAVIALFHFSMLTLSNGNRINTYANLNEYYPRFIRWISAEDKYEAKFKWGKNRWVDRVKEVSNRVDENYSEYDTYYLYTNESWVYALTDKPSTNRFIAWYHINFNESYLQSAIMNRNQAELVIIDTYITQNEALLDDMKGKEPLETYDGFEFYDNKEVSE